MDDSRIHDHQFVDHELMQQKMVTIKEALNYNFHGIEADFFREITRHLSKTVKASYAFVGKLIDDTRIETLSFFGNGAYLDNFSYALKDTPCESVIKRQICLFPNNVHKEFPKDKGLAELGVEGYCGIPLFNSKNTPIGIIVALFEKPIVHQELVQLVMMCYADKAGSEIEHQSNDHKIIEINNKLQRKNKTLKRKRKDLEKLNQKVEFALKSQQTAWFEINFPSGKLTYSPEMVEMLGVDMDGIDTFDQFVSKIHPEERQEIIDAFDSQVDDQGYLKANFRIESRNKEYRWFRASCQRETDTEISDQIFFVGLIEDITDQIENEKERRELEHKYRQLIDNFPNGSILLYDKELKYQLARGPILEKAGYPQEKLIGKSVYEVFPDIADKIAPAYHDSLKGKETTLNLQFMNEWYKTINIPNRDSKGEIIGGIVMTQIITAEKENEEQLKIARSRYQTLLESTDLVAWELDLMTMQFIYVSPKVKRLSGYSVSEWEGFDFWKSILHEEDKEHAINYCLHETERGKDHRIEYRIVTKKGKIKWVRDVVSVIKEKNKPKYLRGFFIDITKQKEAELQIKQSEEKFNKAFQTNPDAISISKLDGRYVEVNEGFTKITGYTPEEAIGKTTDELHISIEESGLEKMSTELTEKGTVSDLELNYTIKHGKTLSALVSASLIQINGEPHILRISKDITERKIVEQKLRQSEEKFSKTFYTNPDAISISKWDGTYVEVNEGFTKITGYTSEEAVGKKTTELNVWQDVSDFKKMLRELSEKGSLSDTELDIQDRNGKPLTVLASASQISIEGEPHILRVSKDITERKLIEQKLKQSEEKFSNAFYTSPDSIAINKLDGTYVDVNFGFQNILGYTSEDVIGKKSTDIDIWVNLEDREKLIEGLQKKGLVANLEAKFRKKNGETDTGLMSASLITIDNEQFILSVTRDISERIHIKKKLEDSERKYRTIIESAHEAIFIANADDGTIIDANTWAEEMLGLPRDQIIGLHQSALHPPEEKQKAVRNFSDDVSNAGKPKSHEDYVVHSSGQLIPVEIIPSKIEIEDGREVLVGFFRDISERIEAKKALEESLLKFKTLAEYTYDWEFWRSTNEEYLYVSPSCNRITGYPPEKFLDDTDHISSIIHEEDLEAWKHHEVDSANQIPCQEPLEFRIIRSDGEIRWISHVCQPVYDRENNFIGTRGSNRDVTVRKSAQLDLAESESKYRMLFENMSSGYVQHELIYDEGGKPADYLFLEVNPAYEKLTHVKKSDVLGRTIKEISPGVENSWLEDFAKIVESGKSTSIEKYSEHLDKYLSVHIFGIENNRFSAMLYDITESRKIEEDLKKSESKLKLHLEQTPLGVIEWNLDAEIVTWNTSAQKIFGYTPEEIEGVIGVKKLVPAYLQDEIWDAWKKILTEGNSRSTNENLTKDGNVIVCDWYNTAVVDNDGNKIGVISIVEDATEREKIQTELKISEERHKMISRTASDYVYSTKFSKDKSLKIDWISGALTRITGYTMEEINNLPGVWRSIIHPDDINTLKSKVAKGSLPLARILEYRIITKNGFVKWVSDTFGPVISGQGKVEGYVGSITDITEKKQAEQNLVHVTERLQRMAEISEEGIIVHEKGQIIESSKAASKITGYFEDELIGADFRDLICPPDVAVIEKKLNNGGSYSETIKALRKDGTVYDMEVHSHPYEYKDKGVTATSFWDVTKAMETERELKQNQDYLKQAQKIAHIGHFHWDIREDTCFFSDELKSIYETGEKSYSFTELFYGFIHPDDSDRIEGIWQNIQESKYKFDEEMRIVTNGKTKWLWVLAEIIQDEAGDKISAVGLCYDITERKLADIKIREHDNQMMQLNKQIADYKMMALRSVMNPHFIFNSLNSIQFFIAKNEKKPAISYLTVFSKLMRNVLNSSVDRYVTLTKEIETLNYYVELEKLRFDDNFDFVLDIDDEIDMDGIEVPSLLIQPYVENAIIHGLSNKHDMGKLHLSINEENGFLVIVIEDDGIGRQASSRLKKSFGTSHKSVGMSVTQERLNIVNKTDKVDVEITDLKDGRKSAGTRVVMKIEISQNK